MADKRISQLPLGNLTPTTIFPIVSDGVTSQTTLTNLNDYIVSNFSGGTTGGTTTVPRYVLGWEIEKQNGSTMTVGRSLGKLILTNGSDTVTGIDGVDFNDDSNFMSPGYSFEATVILPDGTRRYLSFDDVLNSTTATLLDIYTDNQFNDSIGNVWVEASGTFDFVAYFLPESTGEISYAEGRGTIASNEQAHAEGNESIASGQYSHAQGRATRATGQNSHAEGQNTLASGGTSHAEGSQTTAGPLSHAEGSNSQALGQACHAEGNNTFALTFYSHAEGSQTTAGNFYSHAEGLSTTALGTSAHAEGQSTIASGQASHAEGAFTTALGITSHSEGESTTALGTSAHAEGTGTQALGDYSHAEGGGSVSSGAQSHAEGYQTTSVGLNSHAEGDTSQAIGISSHAEGNQTEASGDYSHSEGNQTTASGGSSHAEGYRTTASNFYSHAEGTQTIASGQSGHAEGELTRANAQGSHAEGGNTTANGFYSHAEGLSTTAGGNQSHSGGYNSIASGDYTFVHGSGSTASGLHSIVLGSGVIGSGTNTTYVNKLNIKSVPTGTSVNSLGIDVNGNVIVGSSSPYAYSNTGLASSAITINFATNNIQKITLTGNTEIIFTGMITGYPYRLITSITAETFNYGVGFPSTYIFDRGANPYSFSVLPTIDTVFTSTTDASILSMTVQTLDSKILLGGSFVTYSGVSKNKIVRINPDGTIDNNFVIGTGFGALANENVGSIIVQPDGKIIAGGSFVTYSGVSKNKIVRITSGGTIDSTFIMGTGFSGSFGGNVNALALQPDGKIIVGGNFSAYNGTVINKLIRLNPDGTNDSTFNVGAGFNDSVTALALQSDGKIIVGGAFSTFSGISKNCVARLNTNGSNDSTFFNGSPSSLGNDNVNSIVIQPNGKIIFGNYSGIGAFIYRLQENGTLDSSFNVGSNFDNTVNRALLLPNGKVLVVGYFANYNGNSAAGIARLNSDGSFDSTFKMGAGFTSYASDIIQQPNNKILIGGNISAFSGVSTSKLIRINNIDYPKVNIIDVVSDGTNIILK